MFLSLLHRSLVAAQLVEEFRTHIADDGVWLYDWINAGSAVGRPNSTIGFGHYIYRESIVEFVREAAIEVDRVREGSSLDRPSAPNLIRFSMFAMVRFHVDFPRAQTFQPGFITTNHLWEDCRLGREKDATSVHSCTSWIDGWTPCREVVEEFQSLLSTPA